MAGNARESTTRMTLRKTPPVPVGPTPLVELAAHAEQLSSIKRCDLGIGDWVAVRTRNSWYSLFHLGDGAFLVSGGWFDQQGMAPAAVGVMGCTWGGTAILPDVVACPGLFIEFANGVTTTRVREVHLVRGDTGQRDDTARRSNSSSTASAFEYTPRTDLPSN